jgi:hypothetical protein
LTTSSDLVRSQDIQFMKKFPARFFSCNYFVTFKTFP